MRARIISMVVLAASLLVAGQAWAQSDGSTTFGSQWWSQTAKEAKFQEYRDLPRGGYLGDYLLREFNGSYAAALWGHDALNHNQGNGFYLAKGVTWRIDAQYAETPHNFSFSAVSPFAQIAPGVFVLPDSVQWANQRASGGNYNKSMANVYASAPGAPLGIQTDVSKARFRVRPIKDWQFEVRGTERQRQGSMAFSMSTAGTSNAAELPLTINQRTVDVDAFANYAHGPARVIASVGVSDFKNAVPTLIWDNSKSLRDSSFWTAPTATRASAPSGLTSSGRAAMAPDNRVLRGNAAFSVQLPYSSTFTATLGMSQATQEQAFIPITINSKQYGGAPTDSAAGLMANSLAALPAANLNGKVVTIVQDYRLTGKPLPNLYGTLRIREEKFDDQTPELAFIHGVAWADQVVVRTSATSPANVSEPWSHKNDVIGLDLDYSINRYADLGLLVERRTRTHPLREVGKDKENVFGGNLRLRPMDNFSVTANYKWTKRTQEDTAFVDQVAIGDRLALRRFDLADRNQSVFSGTAMWSPGEKLDLSISGWWNKDDYPDTWFGLKSVQNTQVFGEAGVHPSSTIDLGGGFGYGQMKSRQDGGEAGNRWLLAADTLHWKSSVNDKNVYAFAQAAWWATPKKLQLSTKYTFTRDMQLNALVQPGDAAKRLNPALSLDLPGAFYRSHEVTVEAHWYYAAALEFGCRYGYTKYDVNDAILQSVPYLNFDPAAATTSASALYLGTSKLDYSANTVQVFATRRF